MSTPNRCSKMQSTNIATPLGTTIRMWRWPWLGSARLETDRNKASVGKVNAGEGVRIARSCGDKGILAHCLYYQAASSASYIAVSEEVPILREAIALEKDVGDDPKLLGICRRRLADALDEPGTHAEAESADARGTR